MNEEDEDSVIIKEEDENSVMEAFAYSSSSHDPPPLINLEIAGQEAKSPPRTKIKRKPPGFPSVQRQDSSLPMITKRLVDFLLEASSNGVAVKPKDAAWLLGYDTRRLYEVINTLEAIDLIERNDGKIRWVGATGSETALSKEYSFDLIWLIPNGLATASFAILYDERSYLTTISSGR